MERKEYHLLRHTVGYLCGSGYFTAARCNGYLFTFAYAHCSRINASSGQSVRMGDPIAEVGDTGDATGYHLHFELHQNNIYLNPVYYVT